ncbi:Pyruvate kinase II [wastewater metagenome]|uniref:pyruvate kinase n=2 Tax=unclassified sequences TaxID=12908 RepID=A0A5B8REF3_9ZZZZ|nr:MULTISPECIES: pyruvate kinase [Arhodomonas]MCS4504437.1 pyruvate kinase [Arhodomonas aquaeolei]QEA07250.1 pyruvate kinase II [uncultured organism]
MTKKQVRQTKIVATLGPATAGEAAMRGIVDAGVDVVRLNLSHGSADDHSTNAATLRAAAREAGRVVGVLCDLQGPKIRVEAFRDGPVALESGDAFFLDPTLGAEDGTAEGVGVGYAGLPDDVAAGDILLLADGLIRLRVTGIEGRRIHTRVEVGGTLSARKGINRLGGGLSVRALTDKDRRDIELAARLDADYLAVSFPRDGHDIDEARELLRRAGGEAGIVAKIERREALESLESIMDSADAVMIARGDLAVEIGHAELPGVQKRIMRLARRRECVVITATQMMQSMVDSPVPTRAEVLDVANAVIDGTDAVMLSDETAVGHYPVETVTAMSEVCVGAEHSSDDGPLDPDAHALSTPCRRIDETIAKTAIDAANRLDVGAIAAMTESGATVMWMSRLSTRIPIFALSEHERTRGRVTLYRGVHPVSFDPTVPGRDVLDGEAVGQLLEIGAVTEGELVIITKGDRAGERGGTNTLKIVPAARR